ncbi:MAG: hypothetical protein WB557_27290 [Solirubrobacteraceae bacterium]
MQGPPAGGEMLVPHAEQGSRDFCLPAGTGDEARRGHGRAITQVKCWRWLGCRHRETILNAANEVHDEVCLAR